MCFHYCLLPGRELELVSISFAGEDDRAMRAAVDGNAGAAPQADDPECGEFLGFDIVGLDAVLPPAVKPFTRVEEVMD